MNLKATITAIETALSKHKNSAVLCSFGKDSEVTLHIIKNIHPQIEVVYSNTKVEYPDTIRFKQQLIEEWNLNLIELKPIEGWDFWKVIEKYGFPVGQRLGASATSKCCYYLKKKPMDKAQREHKWDLLIDGMTIYESRQRFLNLKKYISVQGYRYNKKQKLHRLSPILDWTPTDVWDYIEKNNIPYNSFYDKEIPEIPDLTKRGIKAGGGYIRCLRLGCWCCTIPMKYNPNYLKHLRIFYPKLHQLLLQKGLAKFMMEKAESMSLFKHLNPEWLAETRPCLFDGVLITDT